MNANDIVTSDEATIQVEQTIIPTASDSVLKPSIVFINGYDKGRVIILERPQTEVGRASGCHIQIDERGVSRRHLILDMAPDGVQAVDLKSRNGVYVNGERVERCWLNNQDVIRIGGETMLRFSLLSANEIEFMEKMYEAAVLDPLTRVYNRRYFFGLLDHYIERNVRTEQRLALIIIDIDHFKILNDTYGHQVGDFALRHVSSLISSNVREGDKVCRFGGEEFTILLNEIDLSEATSVAERIRATVENSPLLYEGAVIPMTVSIGVATFDHAFGSPDRLFALADARMYEAKNAGRNRVCNGSVPLPGQSGSSALKPW